MHLRTSFGKAYTNPFVVRLSFPDAEDKGTTCVWLLETEGLTRIAYKSWRDRREGTSIALPVLEESYHHPCSRCPELPFVALK